MKKILVCGAAAVALCSAILYAGQRETTVTARAENGQTFVAHVRYFNWGSEEVTKEVTKFAVRNVFAEMKASDIIEYKMRFVVTDRHAPYVAYVHSIDYDPLVKSMILQKMQETR